VSTPCTPNAANVVLTADRVDALADAITIHAQLGERHEYENGRSHRTTSQSAEQPQQGVVRTGHFIICRRGQHARFV
jgi:hypothetical protein